MPLTETRYAHIEIDGHGRPIIAGTTMKVVELVMEKNADDSDAEELQRQHPYLTLGQIHSALAYYADHKEDLDAEIERSRAEVEQLEKEFRVREAASPLPLKQRLQARIADEIERLSAKLRSGKPLSEVWPEIEQGRADER